MCEGRVRVRAKECVAGGWRQCKRSLQEGCEPSLKPHTSVGYRYSKSGMEEDERNYAEKTDFIHLKLSTSVRRSLARTCSKTYLHCIDALNQSHLCAQQNILLLALCL